MREKAEKSIKFFKKSINLFSKCGIEYTVYDKIIEDRQICLFGKYPLPLWTSAVTYREYEYVTREHTIGETVASAMAELRDRLDETFEDAELISNKVTYTVTDVEYISDTYINPDGTDEFMNALLSASLHIFKIS